MKYLVFTVRFLSDTCRAQTDTGHEWPVSPFRFFCALLAGAKRGEWTEAHAAAFQWLEGNSPPTIIAPQATRVTPYSSYVPTNDGDWVHRSEDHTEYQIRTEKVICETHIDRESDTLSKPLHFVWELRDAPSESYMGALKDAAARMYCLGQGTDTVFCEQRLLSREEVAQLEGTRWTPSQTIVRGQKPRRQDPRWNVDDPSENGQPSILRIPQEGSLNSLEKRYRHGLTVLQGVPDASRERASYDLISYDPRFGRLYTMFVLTDAGGRPTSIDPRDAVVVAGLVRSRAMEIAASEGYPDEWISTYVGGHNVPKGTNARISYVPLPSIGHQYAGGLIQRVLVAEPVGYADPRWATILHRMGRGNLLASHDGRVTFALEDLGKGERGDRDKRMRYRYTGAAKSWTSVTPVILPGRSNGLRTQEAALMRKALQHAGLDSLVSGFEVSRAPIPGAEFPSAYRVPKYMEGRDRRFVRLHFRQHVRGPVSLGDGRHCGLGVFARVPT